MRMRISRSLNRVQSTWNWADAVNLLKAWVVFAIAEARIPDSNCFAGVFVNDPAGCLLIYPHLLFEFEDSL